MIVHFYLSFYTFCALAAINFNSFTRSKIFSHYIWTLVFCWCPADVFHFEPEKVHRNKLRLKCEIFCFSIIVPYILYGAQARFKTLLKCSIRPQKNVIQIRILSTLLVLAENGARRSFRFHFSQNKQLIWIGMN